MTRPVACHWFCRVLCFVGIHNWLLPNGPCGCCGKLDEFYDDDGEVPW